MRLSNLRARPWSPVAYGVATVLLLTGVWGLLQQQVAAPRGLRRSVSIGVDSTRQLTSETVTRTIDAGFLLTDEVELSQSIGVRWDGYWYSPRDEQVTLQARSDGVVSVYLDGERVLRYDSTELTPTATTLTLTVGAHQLVVDYESPSVQPDVSVRWTPPGAQPRALPSHLLFTTRLDARDYLETRLVGWFGWGVVASWLLLPLMAVGPTVRRRLSDMDKGEYLSRARTIAFPAMLGPLQIGLFGPHTLFMGNINEFSAPFWRLALHWVPVLAGVVVLLAAVGLVLDRHWFQRYVVALFSVGLLTWLQGGLLLGDYGALDGRALDWSQHAGRAGYEVGLWTAGVIGLVVSTKWVFTVAPFASQLLIALQTVLLISSIVQGGVDEIPTYADRPDFVSELSQSRNVIHLVLDGFQSDVFHEIVENDRAALNESLSGFVFYANHAGAFPTTVASIPAMLTGEVYRNQEPFRPFTERQTEQRSLFTALQAQGFDTDAISIHRPGLASATNGYIIPRPYVGYRAYTRFAAWQLLDLSLFRHAPHVVKPWIYNDQSWRLQVLFGGGNGETTRRRYHPDNGQAFLDDFIRQVRVGRERPVYKFLHVGIPHLPVVLDAGCEFIGVSRPTRERYLGQSTCAVTLVTRLMDRLRALGVYDDSMIVLSSDHGVYMTPRDFSHERPMPFGNLPAMAGSARALLAVKTAGATGPLRISDAPTSITDIPVTVMEMVGAPDAGFPGTSVLRLDDAVPRERSYAWYPWGNAAWNRPHIQRMDLFSIDGRVSDRDAWSYAGSIFEPGTDPEDMSEGWAPPEMDERGDQIRPIREHAGFYALPRARSMVLDVRSTMPPGHTLTLSVLVNGEVVDRIALEDQLWRPLEYPLPTTPDPQAVVRVDLQVYPPARLRSTETRDLGIATRNLEWR